jgi:putative ABC transport system permease protein
MSKGSTHPSWQLALRHLRGRRSRTVLLGCSVVLASALVSAVGSGMNSMQSSLENRIDKAIGKTDARVVHENGSRFDKNLVEVISTAPGVQIAGSRLYGSLTLARGDGRLDEDGRLKRVTANARGSDLDADNGFEQIELESGRHVAAENEIIIDPLTARRLDVGLGDLLSVQRFGEPIELGVVGIVKRPILGALQRPQVYLTRSTLSNAVGNGDLIDLFSIVIDDDLDVPSWVEENQGLVKPPLLLEPSERIRAGFERQVAGGKLAFIFAAMAGFLACSLIVTTGMTTGVAEQQREMAMARLIGASRSHLFVSQIFFGMLICTVAGTLGVPLGNLLAFSLVSWYAEFLPAGFQISLLAALLSVIGACGAGLIGSLLPAWLASRVTPISALAVHAQAPRVQGILLCGVIGLAMLVIQLLLALIPENQVRFWTYSLVGLPLLSIGWFLLAVPVAWLLFRPLGGLCERVLSIPRGLLRGSLFASPFRIGLTSGALMVGLAILTSTWSNGQSLLDSVMERVRFADGFMFKTTGLSLEEQDRLTALPGVMAASPVGYLPLRVDSEMQLGIRGFDTQNVICVGFETESFLELNRLDWIRGTPEEAVPRMLDGDAILVAEQFLIARNIEVGDNVLLGPPNRQRSFEIVGVVGAAGLDIATQFFGIKSLYMEHAVSCVFMDFNAVDEHFNTREAYILQVILDPELDEDDEKALAEAASTAVPGSLFSSGRAIKKLIGEVGTTILGISSSVALVALLLACFAVGNVVAAGIASRKFEFGVLRAVGAPNGTVGRIVLGEVLVMACTASIIGFGMGMHLAWMGTTLYRDLAGLMLELVVPLAPIALGILVMTTLTVAAAVPAIIGLLRKPTRELLASGR